MAPMVAQEPDVQRYQHAARELERFARLRVYESDEPQRLQHARKLLRLAVGLRRLIDQWPPRMGGTSDGS